MRSERSAWSREIRNIERRIDRTTGTLARRFDQVLAVLEGSDYVRDWELSEKGELLTSVYNESDLLVIESLPGGSSGISTRRARGDLLDPRLRNRGPEGPPPRTCRHRHARAYGGS